MGLAWKHETPANQRVQQQQATPRTHLPCREARGVRGGEHVVSAGVDQRRLLLRKAAPQHEHQAPAVRAERSYRGVRDRLPPDATCTRLRSAVVKQFCQRSS